MKALWPEVMTLDLFDRVRSLAVPVVLAEGRHDHQVPAEIAVRWFDALDAPIQGARLVRGVGPRAQQRGARPLQPRPGRPVLPLAQPGRQSSSSVPG